MTKKADKELTERTSAYLQRIRDLRVDNDISQEEAGRLTFVHQRTYSDYENGRIRIPVDALIALARYYDVDMNYICGLTKKKNPFPKD